MPWLLKNHPDLESSLLFIHVPRCGGTSLMQHFDVPKKVMAGRSLWGRFGMTVLFHRYKLFEKVNFPIFTVANLILVVILVLSICLRIYTPPLRGLGVFLTRASITFLISLSFIFTAPIIGRFTYVRRLYLLFVHYILCRGMESVEWCTGTNISGYMMHLTAHKLLRYGYITEEELEKCCSLAIVRNPYSRMVSVYMYNRFGKYESFRHFVRSWHRQMQPYLSTGQTEEWYTPCHQLPQFEFTHHKGKQLVQSIVKQEQLKFLRAPADEEKPVGTSDQSSIRDLPDTVRNALLRMPHANKRSTSKKWYEYYDQETLNLTYQMYKNDFQVFCYSPVLEQRPDLRSPVPTDRE